MSKLESEDLVVCQSCGSRMKELTLCNTRSRVCDEPYLQRCTVIVCEHCEFCQNCRRRKQDLRNGLIKHRYGRDNQTDYCAWYLERLKQEFNEEPEE